MLARKIPACFLALATGSALFYAGPLWPEATGQLTVRLETVDVRKTPVEAVVEATRRGLVGGTGRRSGEIEVRSLRVAVPGEGSLQLDLHSVYELTIRAPGYWSPALTVTPVEPSESVTARLFPTGRIEAQLAVGEDARLPDKVEVRLKPSESEKSLPPGEASVPCAVADGLARCEIPAGSLHLRLRAPDFVSHYFWDRRVAPGALASLGVVRLRRGASVAGLVDLAAGRVSPQKCTVRLLPAVLAASPSRRDTERRSDLALAAAVNEHGFFHFAGVSPGDYRLEISHPGFALASLAPVKVLPDRESVVLEPIALHRPLALEVAVDPPLDARDRPWILRVLRNDAASGQVDSVAERSMGSTGEIVIPGLSPGELRIQLIDSSGQKFISTNTRLEPGSSKVLLEPDLVGVEGTILLGGDPLEAALWFGGRRGAVSIRMDSNEEGAFDGILPREGNWKLEIEGLSGAVRRTVKAQKVKRSAGAGVARVRIELPATELTGKIVREDGSSFAGGLVSLLHTEETTFSSQNADPQGRFSFGGLAYGTYSLSARGVEGGRTLVSDSATVFISETAPAESQTLVLRESASLEVRVVSGWGPVIGAMVIALPRGPTGLASTTQVPPQVTDLEGRCLLRVPQSSTRLDVIIIPPGRALETAQLLAPFHTPLEFWVEDYGGVIVLENASYAPEDPFARQPVLFHNGVFLDLGLLAVRRVGGGTSSAEADISLRDLAPGDYAACWVAYADQASLAIGAPQAPPGECSHGFLPARGELRLSLP